MNPNVKLYIWTNERTFIMPRLTSGYGECELQERMWLDRKELGLTDEKCDEIDSFDSFEEVRQ